MTDLESLGLSPDQIEQLERIKALAEGMTDPQRIAEAYEKYAKAITGITRGMGVTTDNLKALAKEAAQFHQTERTFEQFVEALEKEGKIRTIGAPLRQRIWWRILDALDFIRRLLRAAYRNSGEMVDPDSYGHKRTVPPHNH